MAAILNHPSSEEQPNPGLQNHDGKPAATNLEVQGEAMETGRTSDPQTSIHNALVAHVGGSSSLSSSFDVLSQFFIFSFLFILCLC